MFSALAPWMAPGPHTERSEHMAFGYCCPVSRTKGAPPDSARCVGGFWPTHRVLFYSNKMIGNGARQKPRSVSRCGLLNLALGRCVAAFLPRAVSRILLFNLDIFPRRTPISLEPDSFSARMSARY